MLVFATYIDVEVSQLLSSQTILGQHTLYHLLEQSLVTVRTGNQSRGSHLALSTGVASVTEIYTVCPLVSCQYNFVGTYLWTWVRMEKLLLAIVIEF